MVKKSTMTDKDYAEIPILAKKIENHKGMKLFHKWSNLQSSYISIFALNRIEILKIWDLPNQNQELLLELLQNVREPTIRVNYENRFFQGFHNYICGVQTLDEHTERFMQPYINTNFSSEYMDKKNAAFEGTYNIFLKKLRNYVLHFDIPPIAWTINVDRASSTETFHPKLGITALKKYNGWTDECYELFEKNSDDLLDIYEIVEKHGQQVDKLYQWLFSNYEVMHQSELKALKQLQDKLYKLLHNSGSNSE